MARGPETSQIVWGPVTLLVLPDPCKKCSVSTKPIGHLCLKSLDVMQYTSNVFQILIQLYLAGDQSVSKDQQRQCSELLTHFINCTQIYSLGSNLGLLFWYINITVCTATIYCDINLCSNSPHKGQSDMNTSSQLTMFGNCMVYKSLSYFVWASYGIYWYITIFCLWTIHLSLKHSWVTECYSVFAVTP